MYTPQAIQTYIGVYEDALTKLSACEKCHCKNDEGKKKKGGSNEKSSQCKCADR